MVGAIRNYRPRTLADARAGGHATTRGAGENILDVAVRHLTGDDFGRLGNVLRARTPRSIKLCLGRDSRDMWPELGALLIDASRQTTGVTRYTCLKVARSEMLEGHGMGLGGSDLQAFVACLELYDMCAPVGVVPYWIGVMIAGGARELHRAAELLPSCLAKHPAVTLKVTCELASSVPPYHVDVMRRTFLPVLLEHHRKQRLIRQHRPALVACIKRLAPRFEGRIDSVKEEKKDV